MMNMVKRDERIYSLYENAYMKLLKRYSSDPTMDVRATLKKFVFLGIKKTVLRPENDYFTRQEAEYYFTEINLILSGLSTLSPGEFINMFPVTKEYNGHKYQSKDYFYTMDYIRKLPQNEPIGKNIRNLLWEYTNKDISLFLVKLIDAASNLRRLDGHPGIMEEWAETNGVETFTLHKDNRGKEFLISRKTGKVIRVKPSRHLHAVK